MLNICLSGFDSKEKTTLSTFIEELSDIGFKQSQGMTFQVNVLVCNSAFQSDKYKVAKRLDVDVVNKEWIYNCYNQRQKIDTKKYLLKPFRNIKLALLGFMKSELDKLKEFIVKNEGVVESDINQSDLVVFKKGSQFEFELKNCTKCLVDSDWIMQCYERAEFVPTQYFQYNQQKLNARELLENLQGSGVLEALKKVQLSEYCYLTNCVIYIAVKDDNLKRIISQLISAGDGFYVNTLLPIVTHVIYLQGCSEEVNQQIYQVIHPMWLCECFRLRRRLREDEYQIRIKSSFEQTAVNSFAASQEEIQRDQFVFGKIPDSRAFGEENNNTSKFGLKSQSFSNNNSNMLAFNRFSGNTAKKTKLFEQCQIFVFDHPTLDKAVLSLLNDNGALVERLTYPMKVKVSNLKISKSKAVLIFLLPDHEQCKETIQIIEKDCKVQSIKYYSYRWVNYCLEKNLLELQVVNKKLYHLQPTNQQTPTQFLKNKLIYVTTKDINQKVVFKELAKIVTGKFPEYKLSELDYYVSDKQGKKFKQILDINRGGRLMNQIEIKDIDWLLQQYIKQQNQ
ncbi:unnamed protein product [Paramecium octaurelia]|uniref:BRCT domain-containing protein n=1 Tax=Paramecium octaurelia TaxID=43137 RepID=A0A8S1XJY8_PAROT|nr:unnamed protein product [Paramecium octaurelia]